MKEFDIDLFETKLKNAIKYEFKVKDITDQNSTARSNSPFHLIFDWGGKNILLDIYVNPDMAELAMKGSLF